MFSPNVFQLFQPIGGVAAKLGLEALSAAWALARNP
jgi:hypothetical protein